MKLKEKTKTLDSVMLLLLLLFLLTPVCLAFILVIPKFIYIVSEKTFLDGLEYIRVGYNNYFDKYGMYWIGAITVIATYIVAKNELEARKEEIDIKKRLDRKNEVSEIINELLEESLLDNFEYNKFIDMLFKTTLVLNYINLEEEYMRPIYKIDGIETTFYKYAKLGEIIVRYKLDRIFIEFDFKDFDGSVKLEQNLALALKQRIIATIRHVCTREIPKFINRFYNDDKLVTIESIIEKTEGVDKIRKDIENYNIYLKDFAKEATLSYDTKLEFQDKVYLLEEQVLKIENELKNIKFESNKLYYKN